MENKKDFFKKLAPVPKFSSENNNIISLNGEWDLCIPSSNQKGKIVVPGEIVMQGYELLDSEVSIYEREIEINEVFQGKTIIRFDGVSSYCKVYFNNEFLGDHEGGFVPFQFDIAAELIKKVNKIKVEVQGKTVSDTLGVVSQYAAHTVAGILRKVNIINLGENYLEDIRIETKLLENNRDFKLIINGEKNVDSKSQISIFNKKNRKEIIRKLDIESKNNEFKVEEEFIAPLMWNAETPNLYVLRVELGNNKYEFNLGFREIKISKGELLVNNSPVKLFGVNRHEIHPLTGRTITPELCYQDAKLFKEANLNYIRTSHYPASEEFLEACDEIGLFVESESALAWVHEISSPIWFKGWNYEDEKFLKPFALANTEKIMAEKNRTSIIMWSIANESSWGENFNKVNKIVKEMDPTRPTVFHDNCWGTFNNLGSTCDIANDHYPGFESVKWCEKEDEKRPILFGEYGHTTVYSRREVESDPEVKSDSWSKYLALFVDEMYKYRNCIGGAIWSGIDDMFHISQDKIRGYGPWGLIDGWRRRKPEYTGVRNAYTPIKVKELSEDENNFMLTIQNRYSFSNFKDMKVKVTCENSIILETYGVDIKPREEGILVISKEALPKDKQILVEFIDINGKEVNTVEIQKAVVEVSQEENNFHLNVFESEKVISIVSNSKLIDICKKTGKILQMISNDETIAVDSGDIVIVEMNRDDGGVAHIARNNYTEELKALDYKALENYSLENIRIIKDENEVRINMFGTYPEGRSEKVIKVYKDLRVEIEYNITFNKDIHCRQLGIFFNVQKNVDKLSWKRDGLWKNYHPSDIDREMGVASANPYLTKYLTIPRLTPTVHFKDDSTYLGSNDFRSTKVNVNYASLLNKNSRGIEITERHEGVRAFVSDKFISFMMLNFSGIGSCPFILGDRKIYRRGEIFKGKVTFKLI